ncbi:MAG: UDP-galactopyranose mutase [Victivallaceae bacterium]|nr:UDP-galactopyranose mutase [Victivallaceae bacterium]
MEGLRYLVVGCGFFGSVVAERISTELGEKVLVIDRRPHIGGSSYSEIDGATGIECHRYGSHIFHTMNKTVWDYLNRFTGFNTYQHKVVCRSGGRMFFMPINLKTLNDFFGMAMSPGEAVKFMKDEIGRSGVDADRNLEERAISLIGRRLYEAFIRDYTAKQWGCDPTRLPAGIISRLPVRMDYNVNYFNAAFQGIPLCGYGELFKRILANPNIELRLNTSFAEIKPSLPEDCTVIYTGMIDELYDYRFGQLEWRSLRFENEAVPVRDYQGNSVVNYCDNSVPYTRIHEFKHYHPERQDVFNAGVSMICREYPQVWSRGKEAFYPVESRDNLERLRLYQNLAEQNPRLIPGGRLGSFKYWDMDKAIEQALVCFDQKIKYRTGN